MLGQARKIDIASNLMGSSRKLVRVMRLTSVFGDVNRSIKELRRNSGEISKLYQLEICMMLLSDFFNLLYYFTDHYTLLYLVTFIIIPVWTLDQRSIRIYSGLLWNCFLDPIQPISLPQRCFVHLQTSKLKRKRSKKRSFLCRM